MFDTLFYKPIYNALILLLEYVPNHNIVFAVIYLTIIISIILLPMSKKIFKSQIAQRKIAPIMAKIQEEYKNDRNMMGVKMMEVYKEYGVNPFVSILLLFIQIPIFFALYFVFNNGGLPVINTEYLYAFNMDLLNINIQTTLFGIDFTKVSVFIGIIAGISQYVQMRLSLDKNTDKEKEKELKNKKIEDLKTEELIQKQMTLMIKYIIPFLIFFASLTVSAAVALYWIIRALFMICQEIYFHQKYNIKY